MNLEKKSKLGGIILPDFKNYYKSVIILQCGYIETKHVAQWNRIEIPEINPYLQSVDFYKHCQDYSVKKVIFQQSVLGKGMQKNEFDSYLKPCTKINSKWIINLTTRDKTITLIRKHRSEYM